VLEETPVLRSAQQKATRRQERGVKDQTGKDDGAKENTRSKGARTKKGSAAAVYAAVRELGGRGGQEVGGHAGKRGVVKPGWMSSW
jgi:hypothetical protein